MMVGAQNVAPRATACPDLRIVDRYPVLNGVKIHDKEREYGRVA